MHLNVRIFILSDETKHYEILNGDLVDSIRSKWLKFYEDYEIDPPSKELAVHLLDNSFSQRSVTDLKHIKTTKSKQYEFFSTPLVILLKQKPVRKQLADGNVYVSYWEKAQKLIQDKEFLNKIWAF